MHYPWIKLPMLKSWLEAVEMEDEIVLNSLSLAGRKSAKRLSKRHEELVHERLRISREIEKIWETWEETKKNAI
jgi:hypothetical protein